jgi:hypothetical protein
MKSRMFRLGSARASRAKASPARTDAALGIANFSAEISDGLTRDRIDCGEAPQSAREAHALPETYRQLHRLVITFCVATFAACETANYAPSVTPAMTRSTSRTKQNADAMRLDRGRNLFVHRCIECHTLPAMWKYSREDWPKIVNDMSHRASLKPTERDAIVAYILAVRANER